jgi:CHAT domain-containing protein
MNFRTYFYFFNRIIFFVFCSQISYSASFLDPKLEMIRQKLEQGKNEEVISAASTLIKKQDQNSISENLGYAFLYKAKALASDYRFTEANKVIQTLTEKIGQEIDKQLVRKLQLQLADYYLFINDIIKARTYLEQANSKLNSDSITCHVLDVWYIEAALFAKEGFTTKALEKVNLIENYRKNFSIDEDPSVTLSNEAIPNKTINLTANGQYYQKKSLNKTIFNVKYAEILVLKSEANVQYGNIVEAEKTLNFAKSWISKNLGKGSSFYQKTCLAEAKLFELKQLEVKSLDAYFEAYITNPRPESDALKLKAWTSVIKYLYYLNDDVKANNYLRKLQMYAFRHVSRNEPIQLAYEYTEAIKSFLKSDFSAAKLRINRLEKTFSYIPANYPEKIDIQILKSDLAFYEGRFDAYRALKDSTLNIAANSVGIVSPYYQNIKLTNTFFDFRYNKKFEVSKKVIESAYYSTIQKEIDIYSPQNIFILNEISSFYLETNKYDSALATQQKALIGASIIYSKSSAEYLTQITNLIEVQYYAGLYQAALENLKIASNIATQLNGSNKRYEKLIKANIKLANMFKFFGDVTRSSFHLKLAKNYGKFSQNKHFITLLELDFQQAILYSAQGSFNKANLLLTKSIQDGEQIIGKSHPFLKDFYLENTKLNIEIGNYNQANSCLEKLMVYTNYKSVALADILLVRSEYFLAIFDYKKALESAQQADLIFKNDLGESHLKRAQSLIMIARLKSKIEKVNTPLVANLYDQTLQIVKTSLGEAHPFYLEILQKKAEYLIAVGKFDEAEKSLAEAQKMWTVQSGEKNINLASVFMLQGNLLYLKGEYANAEKKYLKSSEIYVSFFDVKHPMNIKIQSLLARNYFMQGKNTEAFNTIASIIPVYLDYTIKYFPTLSFQQKSKFWNTFKDDFEFYTYLVLDKNGNIKPKLRCDLYNMVISTKALLLNSDIKLRKAIVSSNDSLLIAQFNEWISKKEILTQSIGLSKTQQMEQGIDIKSIENEIEKLEVYLSSHSSSFGLNSKRKTIDWKEIRDVLEAKEYAVEMVRYRTFNKFPTDTVKYAALILNKDAGMFPELVKFENGSDLEKKYLKYYRNAVIYQNVDEYSFEKFWQPIKSKIEDGSTIYFSSEGVYNQVNIELMVDNKGGYPIDLDHIVLITNTKDLVVQKEKEKKITKTQDVILCGNAAFYSKNSTIDKRTIPSLPGTEAEISLLEKISTNAAIKYKIYTNANLIEDTIKKLKNPRVFHIATHGYFKESNALQADELISNPMLNSGLMLAESGDIIDNIENPYVNQKSGILTASEAIDLNFDKTDLVVLSACETGRGDIQVGEGVFGLQRSFLVAGSKAIILSLFKVNDEVTKKLMQIFYESWFSTGNIRKSFNYAKQKIKSEYNSPIYWGSFVMIERIPKNGK